MRFFLILLISALFVFNCSDKTSPVEVGVDPDPYEQIWGYWLSSYTLKEGDDFEQWKSDIEELFIFHQGDSVLYRIKRNIIEGPYALGETVSPWSRGGYTYDWVANSIVFHWEYSSYRPYFAKAQTDNKGNLSTGGYVSYTRYFTKQDTLPDWATN